MRRLMNSLQLQLYAILVVFIAVVSVALLFNLQSVNRADVNIDNANAASLQRSNAYLLASLARRYANAEDESARNGVRGLLESTITNVEQIQLGLEQGDESLELSAIERPELLRLMTDLDNEWARYITLLEAIIAAEDDETEQLLTRIDAQSVQVFTLADRLVRGFDLDIEQQQDRVVQQSISIAVTTGITIIAAIIVVTRIVRSITDLAGLARTLGRGNLEIQADTTGPNEVAEVATAFNSMTTRINRLIGQLEEQVKTAEEARVKAEQSDQVKSAFLASMSHELRTPLNSVINFTKFVVRGVMGPVTERQTETLNKVVASGQHLLNLINDVLDMSKIESGSLNLFIEEDISINKILDTVVASAESLTAEKPVALKTDIQADLPLMVGDRKRLTQIFLNVVSNACKYTQEGYVKVTARMQGDELYFSVEDTGPGIAEEDKSSVFESFRQTNTGLRQGEGTGLGMPISKSLAEAHGGKLWFTSEVDKGSTFFVTLPIKSPALEPTT